MLWGADLVVPNVSYKVKAAAVRRDSGQYVDRTKQLPKVHHHPHFKTRDSFTFHNLSGRLHFIVLMHIWQYLSNELAMASSKRTLAATAFSKCPLTMFKRKWKYTDIYGKNINSPNLLVGCTSTSVEIKWLLPFLKGRKLPGKRKKEKTSKCIYFLTNLMEASLRIAGTGFPTNLFSNKKKS